MGPVSVLTYTQPHTSQDNHAVLKCCFRHAARSKSWAQRRSRCYATLSCCVFKGQNGSRFRPVVFNLMLVSVTVQQAPTV